MERHRSRRKCRAGRVCRAADHVANGRRRKEFWAYPLPLLLVVGGIFFSERIALALVKRRFSSDETYSDIFRYGNHRLIQMDTASAVAAVEQAKTANS